ncbi:MAG: DUF1588 domain-containing protein [bacterium]
MEIISQLLEDPAYRHLVLNHLPVTGLFIAWIVVTTGAVAGQRTASLLGCLLVLAMAGSSLVVAQAGDQAYTVIYETLDGPGKEHLDEHADLAGDWVWLLVATAASAGIAFVTGMLRPELTRRASAAVALCTLASLAGAFVIADAGGRIRHFRGHNTAAIDPDARPVGGPVAMRRLSPGQLERAIHDALGSDIEVVGRFDPEVRHARLLAIGNGRMTVTPSGFERQENLAQSIAEQVLAPERRDRLLPCQPASAEERDDGCTAKFVRELGEKLFRRPLREDEIEVRVAAAGKAADEAKNFDKGTELALITLLVSPEFLFRIERTEATDDDWEELTTDSWATRVSFLLWDAPPDAELLDAVRSGTLGDRVERARQVERMLSSDRIIDGTRAFFADLFRFDELETSAKDPQRYTFWNQQLAQDAREQTLRLIADHLAVQAKPYPDLFTTRRNFLTRSLGPIYAVPVRAANGWEAVEFPEGHTRTGILSHAVFHILHSHPGRSSPTLRGAFLRESILCQIVPPAPADVEFALFNDDQNEELRTARERLKVHSSDGSCRGCHQLTDPIGLGLENFDAIGRYRRKENGAPIDPGGEIDGVSFADHRELGAAIAAHPRLVECLVTNLYRFAVGREEVETERGLLARLGREFEENSYKWKPLMRAIALSEGFGTAPGKSRELRAGMAEPGENGGKT